MASHFTIPIRPRPCSGTVYTAMPAGLSSYMSADEYSASMARVMAANRAALSTRLLYGVAWTGYMLGLLQLCGLFSYSYSYNGNYYWSSYANNAWIGLGVSLVSFVALISLSRYMRKRRAVQVAAAVQLEHLAYATRQPALAWRVVDEAHIEIDVVDHHHAHIAALEHTVHVLQAQVAAQQQHQAADHELIAHQQAAASAAHAAQHQAPLSPPHFHVQYYPSVAAAPAAHVPVEPVYAQAVYQPAAGSVFAHPPPQYYAPQPRNDMRAALVQHQY